MTQLALIRHGLTAWNHDNLVQGRTDIRLGEDGVAQVKSWTLPAEIEGFAWLSSTLKRARQTAALLHDEVSEDARLVEMSWGQWEGKRLADLRAEIGDLMIAWEARGLDFQAPGGESPRQVQTRVRPLLAEIAAAGQPTVAVSHNGLIRAIYALAIGWDMKSQADIRLAEECVQLFDLGPDGMPAVRRLNISLVNKGEA